MTSLDAIKFISLVEQSLRTRKALPEDLATNMETWILNPTLMPIAELVSRAWLEAVPTSVAARDVLHSCLMAANRKAEADLIESGAVPSPLLADSEEERRHIERLINDADARLRDG